MRGWCERQRVRFVLGALAELDAKPAQGFTQQELSVVARRLEQATRL